MGLSRSYRRRDLFDPFAHFNDLDCASLRMRLDAPPGRPGVGFVVMVDVSKQEARLGLVDDDTEVAVDTYGPKVLVFRLVDPVKLEAGIARIGLEVEG